MAKFMHLKCAALRARSVCMDEHSALLEQLRSAKTLEEANALIPQLERIEDIIEEHSAPLAFASKGEEQWSFCLAADYDDTWCITRDSKGRIVTAMKCYHMCMSGHSTDPCMTVI